MAEAGRRGEELTLQTAAILQRQGYEVTKDAGVAGVQVDLLATRGKGRGRRRVVVECKAYSRLVGVRSARPFAATVQFLRETKHADAGWLVTTSGFTQRAREIAERYDIKFATLSELRSEFSIEFDELAPEEPGLKIPRPGRELKKRVFVIMPFTPEMDDVFLLGIRWVADSLGVIVHRSDDLEHNGEIIGEIQRCIREYDGVIGDTTGANANVCYEVGFAHALETPTVLICRKGGDLPFDLQGVNHVMYKNIGHLREALPGRLRSALNL